MQETDMREKLEKIIQAYEDLQGRMGDPAVLAYTSGTTGAPKGALLPHRNLLASVEALGLAWRWSPARAASRRSIDS